MPIYERSVADLMRSFAEERPDKNLFTADEIYAWFHEHWSKIKRSTVTCHMQRMSTNVPGRVNYSAVPGRDDLFFRVGPGQFRRYDPATDPEPIYERQKPPDQEDNQEEDAEDQETFVEESHLRDYLTPNLHILEPGLRLYEEEGIRGIEYPIRNRRIDLLAVGQGGAYVVIELKVSRGHERTVGQLLTYMGWVRRDLADGKPVRGIIVAHKATDELVAAVQEVSPKIGLFEYDISFQVRPVPVS